MGEDVYIIYMAATSSCTYYVHNSAVGVDPVVVIENIKANNLCPFVIVRVIF